MHKGAEISGNSRNSISIIEKNKHINVKALVRALTDMVISEFFSSYQKFIVRPLLREPRPKVHYKSQPNAKTPRKTQKKSTNVKSLTKIVWFHQFSELDRISHGADVVGQSVPGGRTRM